MRFIAVFVTVFLVTAVATLDAQRLEGVSASNEHPANPSVPGANAEDPDRVPTPLMLTFLATGLAIAVRVGWNARRSAGD